MDADWVSNVRASAVCWKNDRWQALSIARDTAVTTSSSSSVSARSDRPA